MTKSSADTRITFLSALLFSLRIAGEIAFFALSIGIIWLYSTLLGAALKFRRNDNKIKLEHDAVTAGFAGPLIVIHALITLITWQTIEPSLPFYQCLALSLFSIGACCIGIVLGGAVAVLAWGSCTKLGRRVLDKQADKRQAREESELESLQTSKGDD